MILHVAEAVSCEHINPHFGIAVGGGRVLRFTTWTFKILPWSTPCKNHYVYVSSLHAQEERVSKGGGVSKVERPRYFFTLVKVSSAALQFFCSVD